MILRKELNVKRTTYKGNFYKSQRKAILLSVIIDAVNRGSQILEPTDVIKTMAIESIPNAKAIAGSIIGQLRAANIIDENNVITNLAKESVEQDRIQAETDGEFEVISAENKLFKSSNFLIRESAKKNKKEGGKPKNLDLRSSVILEGEETFRPKDGDVLQVGNSHPFTGELIIDTENKKVSVELGESKPLIVKSHSFDFDLIEKQILQQLNIEILDGQVLISEAPEIWESDNFKYKIEQRIVKVSINGGDIEEYNLNPVVYGKAPKLKSVAQTWLERIIIRSLDGMVNEQTIDRLFNEHSTRFDEVIKPKVEEIIQRSISEQEKTEKGRIFAEMTADLK